MQKLPDPSSRAVDAGAARPPMRVAFVTETYPPEVNGVATTTARFVEGLVSLRHEVQLVRPRQSHDDGNTGSQPGIDEVLVPGLPIPRYPHLRMGLPRRQTLVRLWQRRRPDVVHVATEGPLGWSAVRAARQLGLPVTSDFRTNFHAYSKHYGIGWLHRPIMAYLRGFHNRCACTLVPTELLRRELDGAGFQRLKVVPRGVDTLRFAPTHRSPALRESWGAGPDDLVVGCVGRLAPEKNLPLMIAAFDRISASQPRARLVLVGEGPMEPELRAARPDARFCGVQRGVDLAAHYASMDLFLFPSMTETFGNVTTEALASGLPVVAFDHAAAGQLIRSGHNGLLAPLGDAEDFVAAAAALAGLPGMRREFGARARAAALDIGWTDVVARFESHLVAACSSVVRQDAASPEAAALQMPA